LLSSRKGKSRRGEESYRQYVTEAQHTDAPLGTRNPFWVQKQAGQGVAKERTGSTRLNDNEEMRSLSTQKKINIM